MLPQNTDQNSRRQRRRRRRRRRTVSDVYELSLQSEWWLMSHYSAADFGDRFLWPDMGPERDQPPFGEAGR